MAALYNIHMRTGCFCNTGACQSFLGMSNEQVKKNLQVKDQLREKQHEKKSLKPFFLSQNHDPANELLMNKRCVLGKVQMSVSFSSAALQH